MGIGAVQNYGQAVNMQGVTQVQPAPVVEPIEQVSENAALTQEVTTPTYKTEAASNQQQDGAGMQRRQSEASESQIEAENKKIHDAISDLNKKMASNNTEAVFGIHDKTNRVTIKMVDKDSKKVLKEFPADKTLDMIAKVWELAGIMVDEKG